MKKLLIFIICILFLTLSSCQKLDVIGNDSIASFEEMLSYFENSVSYNHNNNAFELISPDNSTIFSWCANYLSESQNDFSISVDAKVFLEAGLNESKLPADIILKDGRLIIGTNLDYLQISTSELQTPLKAYEIILEKKRYSLSFHFMGEHYSLKVGDDNSFEWAKDMRSNEMDIVFTLDPQLFVDTDTDLTKIQGWELKIIHTHSQMTMIETEKLVKSFNIK